MSNDDRGNNFMSRTRIDQWNFNSNTFHQSFIVHFGIKRNQMIFSILSPSEYFNFLTLIDWIAHALPILFVIHPRPLHSDPIAYHESDIATIQYGHHHLLLVPPLASSHFSSIDFWISWTSYWHQQCCGDDNEAKANGGKTSVRETEILASFLCAPSRRKAALTLRPDDEDTREEHKTCVLSWMQKKNIREPNNHQQRLSDDENVFQLKWG